jgi:type I restriction enzyme M protein
MVIINHNIKVISNQEENLMSSVKQSVLKTIAWDLANLGRDSGRLAVDGSWYDASLAAYAALRMIESGVGRDDAAHEDYARFLEGGPFDPSLRKRFLNDPDGFLEEAALHLCRSSYTTDDFRDFVLHFDFDGSRASSLRGECTTPRSVRELALAILDLHDGDRLFDECCGGGSFLVDAVERCPGVRPHGTEINRDAAALATARMSLLGDRCEIVAGNVFHEPVLAAYDKVFANHPFGLRLAHMGDECADYLEPFVNGADPMGRPASADWVFARLAYDSLAEGGTAVCIVANGALGNGGDERARRYFVDHGMIRAVVALPAKLFRSTAIGCALVVLGPNDGPVRMVDASDLADEGRRWNTLSPEAVDEILGRLAEDGSMSELVGREAIAARDYSLFASRYLGQAPDLVNPTLLGELALSIERGASIRAQELDSLKSEDDTGLCYLRLSDIEDGAIADDLPNLASLDERTSKQWLRTGDLIISKNGAPFKVAVANVPEGRTILANGNLYVVRLDTARVNPYFLAAFLASEDGKRSLEQMVVGTSIPNLPLANLRQIMVPVPPMDVQQAVADGYRAKLDEIAVLKIRIGKARAAAAASYDEAMNR